MQVKINRMTATTIEPKLDAPGAGLPKPELLIARARFALGLRRYSVERANETILSENARMTEGANGLDSAAGSSQTLIKRLRGMEDSSRNWSVFMTLEHVRIVNESIIGIIGALSQERVPPGTVSTADVKPDPNTGPEVIAALDSVDRQLVEKTNTVTEMQTHACFAHPWFGPLNAAAWHFLAAFHMSLHRRQMEKIMEQLQA